MYLIDRRAQALLPKRLSQRLSDLYKWLKNRSLITWRTSHSLSLALPPKSLLTNPRPLTSLWMQALGSLWLPSLQGLPALRTTITKPHQSDSRPSEAEDQQLTTWPLSSLVVTLSNETSTMWPRYIIKLSLEVPGVVGLPLLLRGIRCQRLMCARTGKKRSIRAVTTGRKRSLEAALSLIKAVKFNKVSRKALLKAVFTLG